MRINKYIASAGLASRRKADELIENGQVKVNGLVIKEMGYDVQEGDRVEVAGRAIAPEKKIVYLMVNKPKGFITSASDEKDRPTVFELIDDIEIRLFPVGRLDYNTSGLLLMTNDGELTNKLTHPKHEIYKTYKVRVIGIMTERKADMLRKGVDIGGYVTAPAQATIEKHADKSTLMEIKIKEGKNRQVRKMCEAVGHKVIDLQRIAIGDLKLGHLKEGHYRKLTKPEIVYLKENC